MNSGDKDTLDLQNLYLKKVTYGDVNLIVGEDEGGVDAGQLGGVAHGVTGVGFGSRMNVQVADLRTLAQKFENKHWVI